MANTTMQSADGLVAVLHASDGKTYTTDAFGFISVPQKLLADFKNGGFQAITPTTVTTAKRPSSAPDGFSCFDSTIGKPIWKLGAVWKDATGATV